MKGKTSKSIKFKENNSKKLTIFEIARNYYKEEINSSNLRI